ncbi:MAG: SMI1/KNR4 family protein, partial [Verrucomicrobiota bacterium]
MNTIEEAWAAITQWHEENTRAGKFKLNPPASEREIVELEQIFGVELPKDVRDSFLLHNGGNCWLLWY